MAIRTVRTFPLRSDGLTQDEYSTGVENSLTDLPLAIEDFNAAASAFQLAVTGTSTTSVTIGTGSKSFTTQTGLGFVVGMTLRIANSSTNYMTGDVTSYNSGTGALVVNVTAVVGSGTLASWTISLSATGASAAGSISFSPSGNIAASNVQSAIQELDTEKAKIGANTDITSLRATAGVAIKGTITNDTAAIGDVGEYVESNVLIGSAVSLTTNVAANVTSISLTAGDWDVSGIVRIHSNNASTSFTQGLGSISSTSATVDATNQCNIISAAVVPGNGINYFSPSIPPCRISLSATTTIYLVARAAFTVSTAQAYGRISARRVR